MYSKLVENITVKMLNESFRDIEEEINSVEEELYDLIYSVDTDFDYNDMVNYVCNDDWYDDDKAKVIELQNQLKDLYKLKDSEYEKEISELPPETNKTNFEGFDITKTDPPFDSYLLKGSRDRDYYLKKEHLTDAYIAEMTPEQYLILCGKYGWKEQFKDIDSIYNRLSDKSKQDIHQYAERMKNGEKAPLPVINVKNQGQEGRHRAFAAIEAGIKTIPVLIEV